MTATLDQPLSAPATWERPLPWQGITSGSIESAYPQASLEKLLDEADLNWTVAKRPLWRRAADGTYTQSPVAHEVYRTDTNEQLGTVKGQYQVYQNHDAFEFASKLAADGVARWADAGLQGNGWRVFVAMQLTEPFHVLGGDQHSLYLFMQTSHDGSASIRGFITPIRFFCTNQVDAIANSAHARFKFPHTPNVAAKMEKAELSFKQALGYQAEFQQLAEALAKVTVTPEKLGLILTAAIPESRARRLDLVAAMTHAFTTSPTIEGYRGTGWGALNAVTEYMDHTITRRTGNARFEQIMGGEGAKLRHELTQRLLALG